MSKRERSCQPSCWPDSPSGNLPEIFASEDVEVAVKSERKTNCVLPPIVERNPECPRRIEPTEPTVENTDSAIGSSRSFNFSQNDQCENLNGSKSRRFLNNRTNATVDTRVPNRREAVVEGLVRRDAALVSTGQRTAVPEPHPRASLDTKKTRNEEICPTSENVIIEEIYLLSLNKRAIPMEQKSRRQGICSPPSLRETTRSDELNGGREVRRCGEILSRRVSSGGSATDLSSSEGLATGVGMARRSRKQSRIRVHPSLRKTRSDESNGFGEIRPCGTSWSHRLATASCAPLHIKEGVDHLVNLTGEAKAAESEGNKGQRMSGERASEGHSEMACAAESEQEQWRPLQGGSDAEEEAKDREEEILACVVTAESVKRQRQRRRLSQRVREANTETRDRKEENLAASVTAESVEKHEQCRRRVGVCESVDKTAARRRRANVLRKKLFGEDLPTEYELMIEQTAERALNKRL